MSLLSQAMEDCKIMDKTTVEDGYGGVITTWTEGASIKAAIVLYDSIQAVTAQAQGANNIYTITTEKTVVLRFHDVIKRLSDGKTFRSTADGDDKKTPDSARINMRQVRAEEFVIPNG